MAISCFLYAGGRDSDGQQISGRGEGRGGRKDCAAYHGEVSVHRDVGLDSREGLCDAEGVGTGHESAEGFPSASLCFREVAPVGRIGREDGPLKGLNGGVRVYRHHLGSDVGSVSIPTGRDAAGRARELASEGGGSVFHGRIRRCTAGAPRAGR